MIYKQCVLTIENNTATLDEDIYLYRLDKNVELYFTIVNNKYKFDKSDLNNIISMTKASYFQMRLYKNTEVKYTFTIQPTDDGKAILTITDDLIDEPIEVGDYDFQISLLDADKSSMVSMPIARQQLHVCEPLVADASKTGTAVLGLSQLDTTGEIVDAFDENGNYIRKVHVNGELISAELFNKWETALETNTKNIVQVKENQIKLIEDDTSMEGISDTTHDNLQTTNKTIIGGINELNSQFKDIVNDLGKNEDGTDIELPTTDKTVKGAIVELFQYASNGKTLIANAITGKGVATNANDSFQTMATNIGRISGIDGAIVQIGNITYRLSTDSTGKVIATKISGVEGLIEGRILLWNEDFEGTEVDLNTWTFDDRDKYNALVNSWTGGAVTTVQDSILHIKAVKQKHGDYSAEWSSDQLWTRKKYANSNCRWECKMKFDVMNGCWPAFWLMGDNFTGTGPESGQGGLGWPSCGELDIMEFMGGVNGDLSSAIHYANIFSDTGHKSKSLGTWTDKIKGNLTDWHIYGCEITDTQIVIDVDGVVCKSINLSEIESDFGNAFKMPMYPLISLQVGQSGGTPDADATEMNVYVDWVRCYAPVGTTISGDIESMQITGLTTEVSTGVKQVANIAYTPVASKNKTVTWSSNNPNIATVENGVIESIADGSATITATSKNGVSTSIDITVSTVAKYPVTALSFDKTYKPVVVGTSYTPTLTITPDYTTDDIVYSTSDSSKFTVDSSTGRITPVSAGTANLIATADSGVTATLSIEIISETEGAYIDAHYNATKYSNDTGIGKLEKLSNSFKYSLDARTDDYTFVAILTGVDRGASMGWMPGNSLPASGYKPALLSTWNSSSNINTMTVAGESDFEVIDFNAITTPVTIKIAIVVKQNTIYYYKNGTLIKNHPIKTNYSAIKSGTTNLSVYARSTVGTTELMLYRRGLSDAEAKAITT